MSETTEEYSETYRYITLPFLFCSLLLLIIFRDLGSYFSLQHPIDKAASTVSFSSEDAFSIVIYLLKTWKFS